MIRHLILIIAVAFAGMHSAMSQTGDFAYMTAPLLIPADADNVAGISNDNIRLAFVRCGDGNKAIACRMEVKVGGKWQPYMSGMEDNKIFVLSAGTRMAKPSHKTYIPSWKHADTLSSNPYLAGSISEAIPVRAKNEDRNTIRVDYATRGNHTVTGWWSIKPGTNHVVLRLSFTPAADGSYSLGVLALHAALPANINNVLLPPLYQYKRLPESPRMLTSAMMQQPLAIVETAAGGTTMSAFVSGDDTTFENEWGSVDHSPMGFALTNHSGMIQPVAFAPVMGMKDSRMTAGHTIERKFIIGLSDGEWNRTLEYISDNVYRVMDYRRQEGVSLTEAMFNIIDLMNDNEYGGWDASMKGFYDIEGKPTKAPTVVHSAPLAIINAAVVANDEQMYITRALPTIEYTLSRKGYRWSTRTTDGGYNKDPETLRLDPMTSQFTTSYFEGLNRLLGRKNEWIKDIALPDNALRTVRGYSAPILSWVQALYAYRLTGDGKWLRQALSVAKRDISLHIYANTPKPVRYTAFYNTAMYGAWWDLIDLYETTGNRDFLDAARYGAAHTIAGIRCYPAVKDSMQVIHPDGKYDGNTTLWWKGNEQYRLGFPRREGDSPEQQVPLWRVSPVGLGFEQPSTYFLRNKGKQVRPVFMSNWAPHMLRLNSHTGVSLYETYARNAVIGRFKNYPGYYATGYTDITMREDFPYKGPDVSSIYYHHIPPHLAFTSDYLVSEAIQRSAGRISFPYGKQEGFVWFSNRIFGGEPGTVFDDNNASLWLRRGLIECDNPEINYITAVSDSRFWIILSGENFDKSAATVKLGSDVSDIVSGSAFTIYTADGKKQKGTLDENGFTADVPAKGLVAISIPVKAGGSPFAGAASVPALKDGMRVIDTATDAGRLFVYRIRSPFGWDSVYGFCETPPAGGITVKVECNGGHHVITEYPYEWSAMKFKPSDTVNMRVNISDAKGNTFEKTITMK